MRKFLLGVLIILLISSCVKVGVQRVELVSPQNNTTASLKPVFIWKFISPFPSSAKFDLYVSPSREFSDPVARDIQSTSYILERTLDSGKTYYWKVVAKTLSGDIESEVWSFKTPSDNPPNDPQLLTPDNDGTSTVNVVFSWRCSDPDGDPLTFRLVISKSADMKDAIVIDGIKDNRYELVLSGNSDYYWKLIVSDDKGLSSESEVWHFKTIDYPPTKPVPKYPEDGATGVILKPTLEWFSYDPEGGKVFFDLMMGKSSTDMTILATGIESLKYRIERSLEQDTWYYWKVVAKDESGNVTEGDIFKFQTLKNEPPTKPELVKGINGEEFSYKEITLAWTDSIDPEGARITYTVAVSTDLNLIENFEVEKCASKTTDSTSVTFSKELPLGTYYWRVEASDGIGGTLSDVATFVVLDPPPPKPELVAPANSESLNSFTKPTFRWKAVSDPDGERVRYDLYLSQDRNKVENLSTDSKVASDLVTVYHNYPTLLSPGTYYWRVVAKDFSNEVGSDVWSFTVERPKPVKLYVVGDGLWYVDLSDVMNPKLENLLDLVEVIKGSAILGNKLFIASYQKWVDKLSIYDVSDRRNPKLLHEYDTPIDRKAKVLFDRYVAFYSNCLRAYDATSDSPNLVIDECPSVSNRRSSVTAEGDYIIAVFSGGDIQNGVSDESYILKIYDRDFKQIYSDFKQNIDIYVNDIIYHDQKIYALYVKPGGTYLGIYSFTRPEDLDLMNPDEEILITNSGDWNTYMKLLGNKIFIYGWIGTFSYDLITSNVMEISERSWALDGMEDVVLVGADMDRIEVFSGNLDNIATIDRQSGRANSLKIVGDYLYVKTKDGNILICDKDLNGISEKPLGIYDALDWKLSGNYLYALDWSNLKIFDVSDPTNPVEVGTISGINGGQRLAIDGNYLYVLLYNSQLNIYDISDPANPALVGIYNSPLESTRYLGVKNDVAIFGSWWGGYEIVDVRDKRNPVSITINENARLGGDIVIKDNYAFVFIEDISRKVVVYDLSEPGNAIQVTTRGVDIGYEYGDVAVYGNYAYMRAGETFYVVDLSDPLNPRKVAEKLLINPWDWTGLDADSNYVYLGLSNMGIMKIDISDPANPQIVKWDHWFAPYDILVVGE